MLKKIKQFILKIKNRKIYKDLSISARVQLFMENNPIENKSFIDVLNEVLV